MSDLIKIRKENNQVVAERLISDMDHNEILQYIFREYRPTMNYKKYGFDKPIWGIGCGEKCILPMDDSERFFGEGMDGIIMICIHLEDVESYGKDLYLMYDDYKEDQGWTEERINIIKK